MSNYDLYTDVNAESRLSEADGFIVRTSENGVKSVVNYIGNNEKPTIPAGVTVVRSGAFAYIDVIGEIVVPEGVEAINHYAFTQCKNLVKVTLPSTLIYIYDYAFDGCENLASVNIPDKVEKIRSFAFNECRSLTGIVIPKSVTKVFANAFSGCSGMQTIYCEAAEQPSEWDSTWQNNCPAQVVWNYNGGSEA